MAAGAGSGSLKSSAPIFYALSLRYPLKSGALSVSFFPLGNSFTDAKKVLCTNRLKYSLLTMLANIPIVPLVTPGAVVVYLRCSVKTLTKYSILGGLCACLMIPMFVMTLHSNEWASGVWLRAFNNSAIYLVSPS